MRLVDIDSLKGCAIIRPTSSEEIAHIQSCPGLIAHKDIPTAYDVEAVVAELEKTKKECEPMYGGRNCGKEAKTIYKMALSYAIEIVRGKE